MDNMRTIEWRQQTIDALQESNNPFDMIVVGGGITGAGIYREAVLRGLKVLLIEQRDFAWGTSSRSSKMVHGGLRYLATGQFGITYESASERQKLLSELAGLVDPLPFLMGHYKGEFPGPWLFDKVLTIYDWMAGARYRHYRKHGVADFYAPGIRQQELNGATQFGDAVVDDARLVMRVLQDGSDNGGIALNYIRAEDTCRQNGQVTGLRLHDELSQKDFEVKATVVINASGAWTDELRSTLGQHSVIRPLRGSHLALPFWKLPVAYSITFSHPDDKRPVFVFPWEGLSVIGTTDLDHREPLSEEAGITGQELDYLLDAANSQFPAAKLTRSDILSSWSGVRPVVSRNQNKQVDLSQQVKPSDEKREHAIWDDGGMISVAGGKLTTFRIIAMDVLRHASSYLAEKIPPDTLKHYIHFDAAPPHPDHRLLGRFGKYCRNVAEIGSGLEGGLQSTIASTQTHWAELIWSCQHESIIHLDDLLLRRSRLGLQLPLGAQELMPQLKPLCQRYLGWDDIRWQEELQRYQEIIKQYYSLPEEVTE